MNQIKKLLPFLASFILVFSAANTLANNHFITSAEEKGNQKSFKNVTSLPFSEFWDINSNPPGWTYFTNSTSGTIQVQSQTAYTNPNSVEISNNTDDTSAFILVAPKSNLDFDSTQVRFRAKSNSYGQSIQFGVMTDSSDPGTFLTHKNISLSTTFGQHIVDLSSLPSYLISMGYHIAIKAGFNSTNKKIYIDNFVWEKIPTCPTPTNFVINDTTATKASFSWNDTLSATYRILYGTQGFNPLTEGDTLLTNSNPDTITGLTPINTYDAYIIADCGGGELSNMIGPITFTTKCGVAQAPWSEDFENSGNIPQCWNQGSTNQEDWEFDNYAGSHIGNSGNLAGSTESGGYFAYVDDGYPHNNNTQLITPYINISNLTTPELTFYLASNNEGYTNVDFSIDVWDGAAWNNDVYTNNTNTLNGGWEKIKVYFNSLTITGPIQIRLVVDENNGSDYYDDIAIDDISIHEAPSCLEPSDLSHGAVTASEASISWTENGSASLWKIIYGPAGFNPYTEGDTVIANNIPDTITGLSPITTYDVYVVSDCGGSESNLYGPMIITTPCATQVAPWNEDFENNGNIPQCWNQGASNSKDWEFDNTGGNNHIGNYGTINGSTASNGYFAWVDDSSPHSQGTALLSPMIDVSGLSIPELSFYLLSDNEGNTNVDFSIDIWDGSSWNNDYFTSNTNTQNGAWEQFKLFFTNLNITGPVQIRLVVDENNGSDHYDDIAIDDISVQEAPACPQPTNLNVLSTSTNEAIIEWDENGNATSWEIIYGAPGFTPGTQGDTVYASSIPDTITGLSSNTNYEAYVKAGCGSILTGPVSFTTPCLPVSAPWSEDFENNGNIPNCWRQGSTNSEDWVFDNTGSGHLGNNGTMGGTTSSGGYFAWVDDDNPHSTGTELISPLIDVGALSTPEVTFYLISNNEGQSNVDFSIDVWDGNSWNNDIYTSNSNTLKGEWEKITVYLTNLNITGNIQLRFVVDENNGTDYYDDIAIDDISVDDPLNNDLECVDIINPPGSGTYSANEDITTRIINRGTNDQIDPQIKYTLDSGATWTSWETINDTLNYSDTLIYTFNTKADLSSGGNYHIMSVVNGTSDQNSSNDTSISKKVEVLLGLQAVQLPIEIGFENSNITIGNDTAIFNNNTDYRLSLNTDNPAIGRATQGSDYPANPNSGNGSLLLDAAQSSLAANHFTITIDMSNYTTSDVKLSYFHAAHGDESHSNDRVWIRGSSSDNWIQVEDLTTFSSTYTWRQSEHTISSILNNAGQTLDSTFQIRLGQEDNFSYSTDGRSFDNIKLWELVPNDLEANSIDVIDGGIELGQNDSIPVEVTITNNGTVEQYDFDVKYSQDSGNTYITETVTDTLIPGNSYKYIFSSKTTFDAPGKQDIIFVVKNTGDSILVNDTAVKTINNIALPYYVNFDNLSTPVLPDGWMSINQTASGYVETSTTENASSPNSLNLYNSSADNGENLMAVIPGFYGDYTDKRLKFNLYSESTTDSVIIGVLAHPDSIYTFTGIDTITFNNSTHEVWKNYIRDISSYQGTLKYIAFKHTCRDSYEDIYIDDFIFENIPDSDLEMLSIIDPVGKNNFSASENITLKLANTGVQTLTDPSIKFSGDNGSTWLYDTINQTINPGDTLIYNFNATVDLSSGGIHKCIAVVDFAADENPLNDTVFKTTFTLAPINLPFSEDFETVGPVKSFDGVKTDVLNGSEYWRFHYGSTDGRLRFNVGSGFYHSGNNAATMDYGSTTDTNKLILDLPIGNYAGSKIMLSFWYMDHGDESHAGDKVWVRGSHSDDWIQIYNLNPQSTPNGVWQEVSNISLDNHIISNGQYITNEFQIMFGQSDGSSANSPTSTDGITFEDIYIEEISCPWPTNAQLDTATSDYASLSWIENGAANNWNIIYGAPGFDPQTQGDTVSVGSNPGTISGLTPNTSYDAYIQADCGSGDVSNLSNVVSFTTACAAVNAPFYEDFENGGNIPVCWDHGTNNNENWIFANTPTAYTGNAGTMGGNTTSGGYFAYIDDSGPHSSNTALLTPSIDISSLNNPELSFYLISHNQGHSNIEFSVDIWDGDSWNNDVFYSNSNTKNGEWEKIYVYFTNITLTPDSTVRVRFVGDETSDFWDDVAIDDVKIGEASTCPNPSNLAVDAATPAGATISWTENGSSTSWGLIYGQTGFDPATGGTTLNVNNNPYTITSLSQQVPYDVYLYSSCGSDTIGPVSFTAPCNAKMAPWHEDFESLGSLPACWRQGDNNNESWKFNNSGFGHIGNNGNMSGNTASNGYFAWVDDSGPHSTGTALLSPFIDLSGLNIPQLSFYLISNNEGHSNVDFSVDMWDGNSWNNDIYTSNSNTKNGAWENITVYFTNYNITGSVRLRFVIDENNSTEYYDDLAIDDIKIEEAPSCPIPTNLQINALSSNQANVSWTENGTATSWNVIYGPAGFDPANSGTTVTATSTSKSITGLTPVTTYDVYIESDCGGSTSPLSNSLTFTTPCVSKVAPWKEDFENNGFLPECWANGVNNTENWLFSNHPGNSHVGNNGNMSGFTQSGGYYGWVDDSSPEGTGIELLSPYIDVSNLTVPELSFYLISNNEGSNNVNFSVDIWDGSSWNTDVFTNNSNTDFGKWEQIFVPLGSITFTGDMRVRLVVDDNNGTDKDDIAIDDLSINEAGVCTNPSNILVQNTTNSKAEVKWTENGSATSWKLIYGYAGFNPLTEGDTLIVNNNPDTLTGLNAASHYYVYVQSNCGSGNSSNLTGPASFNTNCGTVVPTYIQNFDNFTPNCWTQSRAELSDPITFSGTSSNWKGDDFANDPSNGKSAKLRTYGASVKDWLISPSIDLGSGSKDYLAEFDVALTLYANNQNPQASGNDDAFAVVISTDNGNTWTEANTIKRYDNTGNSLYLNGIPTYGEHVMIDLTGYTGTIKLAIYGESLVSNTNNELFADNFKVREHTPETVALMDAIDNTNISSNPSLITYNSSVTSQQTVDYNVDYPSSFNPSLDPALLNDYRLKFDSPLPYGVTVDIDIDGSNVGQFTSNGNKTEYWLSNVTGMSKSALGSMTDETVSLHINGLTNIGYYRFSLAAISAETGNFSTSDIFKLDDAMTEINVTPVPDTLPYIQTFDTGVPASWDTIKGTTSSADWIYRTDGLFGSTTGADGYMKIEDDIGNSSVITNSDLISNNIDMSGSSGPIMLEFEHFYDYFVSDSATLSISNDGGITWSVIEVFKTDKGSNSNPEKAKYNITSQAAGHSNVKFKWNYNDGGGIAYSWSLDDIKVYDKTHADILEFKIPTQYNSYINYNDTTVHVYVPIGTDLSSLTPVFELSPGAEAFVGGTLQVSDSTSVNFNNSATNPVEYDVQAADGINNKIWKVSVSTSTSVEEKKTNDISIYPNPNDGIFDLTVYSENGFTYEITDPIGKVIRKRKIQESGNSTRRINISNFSPGIYSVKIKTAQITKVKKIVIK